MDSAGVISPSSDERLWSNLHDRVDAILERRRLPEIPGMEAAAAAMAGESDAQLLMRGFDSISSSLSLLSRSLGAAQQGLNDLTKPSSILKREGERIETEPTAKRHCVSDEFPNMQVADGSNKHERSDFGDCKEKNESEDSEISPIKGEKVISDAMQSGTLKKAKNLAASMATKSAILAKELKSMRSELCFMHEKCTMLEEENRRLREGFNKGLRPEEDDLVRLQLETLLAEKSRLANENANLKRENECLHQIVEYHQLTSHELSASYEKEDLHGVCLDFSEGLDDENSNQNA